MSGNPLPLPNSDREPPGPPPSPESPPPPGEPVPPPPPRDAMEPEANPEYSLPDIPHARPVLVDALPHTGPSADSISSSLVRLSPWRALLQLVLLFLAGGFGVLAGSFLVAHLSLPDERWANLIVTAIAGGTCILAAFAMVRSAGQRPAAIGWRINDVASDVGIGILAAFGVYAAMFIGGMILFLLRPDLIAKSEEAREAIKETIPRASIPGLVVMMAFVALWEEVIFRGFLLTRLYSLLRRWWLAVPVGALLFSMGHVYEGGLAVIVIGGLGILLGVIFVWRQSLLPVIVLHMIFNLINLLLLRSESQTWK